MAIGYTELDFINGAAPALNAANMNHIDEGVKACADQLDAQGTLTAAGRTDANAIAATAGATLAARLQTAANVENGADVTDEANVTAAAVGTAEITTAPAHIWALVAGALKRITWAGLLALLATAFKHGGSNEIATATPAPNAIPKADGSGKLDGWVSDSAVGTKGKVALAADGGTTAGTAVQGNDARLTTAPAAWTPAPKFGGVADDGTRSTSQNTFIKIGKKYVLDAIISWTAKGTKTGTLTIEGVPASALAATGVPAGTAYLINASGLAANGHIVMIIAAGVVYFKKLDTTGYIDALTDANFSNTTALRIHLEYIAA